MDKFSISKSSLGTKNNNFVNFLASMLILSVAFNLSWLIMFIRLCDRINVIKNLNKTLFNFESLLLLGNLSIIVLLVAYAVGIKSLREILGRRN